MLIIANTSPRPDATCLGAYGPMMWCDVIAQYSPSVYIAASWNVMLSRDVLAKSCKWQDKKDKKPKDSKDVKDITAIHVMPDDACHVRLLVVGARSHNSLQIFCFLFCKHSTPEQRDMRFIYIALMSNLDQ